MDEDISEQVGQESNLEFEEFLLLLKRFMEERLVEIIKPKISVKKVKKKFEN